MATQGMISIMKNSEVIFKCIAGIDGQKAKDVKKRILDLKEDLSLKLLYKICIEEGFGDKETLVVQSKDSYIYKDDDELGLLYHQKFNDPSFNPRWECGIIDHLEIINL